VATLWQPHWIRFCLEGHNRAAEGPVRSWPLDKTAWAYFKNAFLLTCLVTVVFTLLITLILTSNVLLLTTTMAVKLFPSVDVVTLAHYMLDLHWFTV